MIARPYSDRAINPLASRTYVALAACFAEYIAALGNINTPPKDPDHWPPTMSYPIPFWILVVALIYVR